MQANDLPVDNKHDNGEDLAREAEVVEQGVDCSRAVVGVEEFWKSESGFSGPPMSNERDRVEGESATRIEEPLGGPAVPDFARS